MDRAQAGRVLALLAAKYEFEQIARGRLTNDALIAISAARTGITVITGNIQDFEKPAEFRTFLWKLESVMNS
jgi:predicted nucleic acid-binding protein